MGGTLLSAGLKIGGSLLAGHSAKKTAAKAAQGYTDAADYGKGIYGATSQALAPYMSVGTSALQQLAGLWGLPYGTSSPFTAQTGGGAAGGPWGAAGGAGGSGLGVPNTQAMFSALQNFPGYQFGLQQGTQALNHGAMAKGLSLSGGAAEDLMKFGQDYGMQQGWAPYINMLSGLAGSGQQAAVQNGQLGASLYPTIGNALAQGGLQSAAGTAQNGNIMGGLLGQLGSVLGGSSYGGIGGALGSLFGGGGGGGSGLAAGISDLPLAA